MNRKLPTPATTLRLAMISSLLAAVAAGPATAPSDGAAANAPASTIDASVLPATRPATQPFSRRAVIGNRLVRVRDISGLADRLPPNWGGDNSNDPPSDDEWAQIASFASQNFPNRWKLFQTLQATRPADSPLVTSLKDRITSRYRTLQRVQVVSPELYDAAVTQGQLEDDAWGATVAARKKGMKNADLNNKMHDKVAALVKNMLQERQDRLDSMKASLKTEQDKLDSDKEDVDQLVDRQIDRLSGDAPNDPNVPRGMGGGGMGGGRRFDGQGPGGGGGGPGFDGQGGPGRRERRTPTSRPE